MIAGYDLSSLTELLERGGPVVAIILCLSVVALAVIILKGLDFLVRGVGRGGGTVEILDQWHGGQLNEAQQALSRRRNPTAVVLAHAMQGFLNEAEESAIREDSERLALEKLAQLGSHLRVLEATAQLAPLLGLFGTVIGMMSAFQTLQASGADADPAALAGGIWVALTTTAVGLAVAIPAAFAMFWFEGRIERERTSIESALTSLFTRRLVPAQKMQAALSLVD